jgi:hypothetical protein
MTFFFMMHIRYSSRSRQRWVSNSLSLASFIRNRHEIRNMEMLLTSLRTENSNFKMHINRTVPTRQIGPKRGPILTLSERQDRALDAYREWPKIASCVFYLLPERDQLWSTCKKQLKMSKPQMRSGTLNMSLRIAIPIGKNNYSIPQWRINDRKYVLPRARLVHFTFVQGHDKSHIFE